MTTEILNKIEKKEENRKILIYLKIRINIGNS